MTCQGLVVMHEPLRVIPYGRDVVDIDMRVRSKLAFCSRGRSHKASLFLDKQDKSPFVLGALGRANLEIK